MEAVAALNPATPAPYGRACTSCAHAKAKCVFQNGHAKCGRCHRLNKECLPSSSVRGSGIKKKPSTKAARLEEKLDGLVSLLTAASQPHAGQTQTPAQLEASAALAQFGPSPDSLESRVSTPGHEATSKLPSDASHTGAQKDAINSIHQNVYFPDIRDSCGDDRVSKPNSSSRPYRVSAFFSDEADESLALFRTQMLGQFPFTKIPEAMMPQDLRKESPFLWLCIMAFTTKSSERRKILIAEIRQVLATRIFAEGEKSVDLLQGLLLYASWGYYTHFSTPIVTSVLGLAIGMLGNLGLKKPPPKESPYLLLNYDARGYPKPLLPASRTIEDRRMAISCWSISQFASSFFQKTDTMRWIPYYDECLRELTENEHIADTLLVQLVRLQQVHEKVIHAPWHDPSSAPLRWPEAQPSDQALDVTNSAANVPVSFYVSAFQNELKQAREQVPLELRQNELLLLHCYNIELSIHEVALSKTLDPRFKRLESLWAALQAIKSWFELFFQFPPASYVALSFSTFSQFIHCVVALSRLSTYEHPDWDLKLARETCNLSLILDELIDRFARVKAEANIDPGVQDHHDVFSTNARRMSAIKQWWDTKLAAEQSVSTDDQLDENTASDPMLGGQPIDFSDDGWLRDILSLDDYQFSQFGK